MTLNFSKNAPVVVIGGGFGGLTTALSLSSCKERPSIILIEPRPRFVFLPLLYELLSGEMESWEVAPSYPTLLATRGIVLIDELVENIDLDGEVILTSSGQVINYSQLVISTGSSVDSFGIQGVQDHALMFNKFEDVRTVKKLIERLNKSQKLNQNIVIVGAGPTGVELACKVADLLVNPRLVHLIECGERVLINGKSFNQEQVEQALKKKSVKVHLNTRVLKITETNLEIQNVTPKNSEPYLLSHAGVVWTAGVKPCVPSGLPQSLLKDGKILINSKLQVLGYDNVFSIGDIALDLEQPSLGTAQVAMQQGELLAQNIMALIENKALTAFRFADRGEMLSMGIGEATITGMGLTVSGSTAFQIRRIAYLSKFPDLSLTIRSAGSWLLNYGKNFI